MTSEQDDSPTGLDFSRLSETKIAKREQEQSKKREADPSPEYSCGKDDCETPACDPGPWCSGFIDKANKLLEEAISNLHVDMGNAERNEARRHIVEVQNLFGNIKKERERSIWEWIDRYLDDDFFETAGKITDEEGQQKRMNEIPELLKPLAYTIITLAYKNKGGGPCILFRHELFAIYKELLENKMDIYLPHAWFCDGVMIEPEWIVKITNGIIGWSCNPNYDNPDTCGLENCRYRGLFDPSITTIPPITEEPEVLNLMIVHKDGKFIYWSMRDPDDPARKFGEDDAALIRQVLDGLPVKEEES